MESGFSGKCYTCGQEGHRSSDCPEAGATDGGTLACDLSFFVPLPHPRCRTCSLARLLVTSCRHRRLPRHLLQLRPVRPPRFGLL